MNKDKKLNLVYVIGMVITLISCTLAILHVEMAKYLLIVGVLPMVVVRGINHFREESGRFSRIPLILFVSSLFLIAAVVALFMNRNFWILLVFISAVIDLYATFRAPKSTPNL